jgi:hypothetical protein
MGQLKEKPIAVAVLLCLLYVMLCAGLVSANAYFAGGLELPWTWYWILWTALFAPAIFATVFASVWTTPRWGRLKVLNGISLLTILTVMETLWAMDVLMRTALAVVAQFSSLLRGQNVRPITSQHEVPTQPSRHSCHHVVSRQPIGQTDAGCH